MNQKFIIARRDFLKITTSALLTSWPGFTLLKGRNNMYGLIGKMTTVSGKRDEFISVLLEGINDMPGCLSYVVAKDSFDENAIWISEVWDSKESHDASLSLPAVKGSISKGRPMIAGFGESIVTEPVGGIGIDSRMNKKLE